MQEIEMYNRLINNDVIALGWLAAFNDSQGFDIIFIYFSKLYRMVLITVVVFR